MYFVFREWDNSPYLACFVESMSKLNEKMVDIVVVCFIRPPFINSSDVFSLITHYMTTK